MKITDGACFPLRNTGKRVTCDFVTNECKESEFSYGVRGSNTCPIGYDKVTSRAECQQAMTSLGLNGDATVTQSDATFAIHGQPNAHRPGGCSMYSGDRGTPRTQAPGTSANEIMAQRNSVTDSFAYFNLHNGIGHSDYYVLCKNSSPFQPICTNPQLVRNDGTLYLPLDWAKNSSTPTRQRRDHDGVTWQDCQKRCATTPGCVYFNSFTDSQCLLSDGSKGTAVDKNKTLQFSGRATCFEEGGSNKRHSPAAWFLEDSVKTIEECEHACNTLESTKASGRQATATNETLRCRAYEYSLMDHGYYKCILHTQSPDLHTPDELSIIHGRTPDGFASELKWGKGRMCESPVDLMFLLDSSSSAYSAKEFRDTILPFVKKFAANYNVGSGANQTRIAVATFSVGAEVIFSFAALQNNTAVATAVDNIAQDSATTTKGQVRVGLERVANDFLPAARAGVRQVLVVLSAGEAGAAYDPTQQARRIRRRGVEIFAVGQ